MRHPNLRNRLPRYRRNRPPRPGLPPWLGRQTVDERTGMFTYEAFLVRDDFGVRVDSRSDGFDIDKERGDRRR